MLSGLLRIARLDQGGPPARAPVDVVELCRTEVERAEPFAPHLRFDLRLRNAPTTPVDLDAEGVREAVSNLIDNARRHAVQTITVEVSADDHAARIEVDDDGAGVPPDDRDLVFERFA